MSEKKDKPENIRPNIKDFFGESATLQQVHETYLSQPQLFKYAQALDNYIDESTQRIKELEDENAEWLKKVEAANEHFDRLLGDNYNFGQEIIRLSETIATQSATIQHQKYLIEELEKDKVALKNEIARIVNLIEQPGGYEEI